VVIQPLRRRRYSFGWRYFWALPTWTLLAVIHRWDGERVGEQAACQQQIHHDTGGEVADPAASTDTL